MKTIKTYHLILIKFNIIQLSTYILLNEKYLIPMTILGIDYDKCINCKECVMECPNYLYEEDLNEKILFIDPNNSCIKCGHCISICPVDAIIYENMGEAQIFNGIENPEILISHEKLKNFLQSIRSVRRYKKNKVPHDKLRIIVEAMHFAPTGANIQSENITIISDSEKIRNLSNAIIDAINKDKRYSSYFERILNNQWKRYDNAPVFFDAPHVIIIHTRMPLKINYFNIANIISYGRIMAHSLGYGTCYIGQAQMASEMDPSIIKAAGVSGKIFCAITLGSPDVKYLKIPPRLLNRSNLI
jgi:ferredoxin